MFGAWRPRAGAQTATHATPSRDGGLGRRRGAGSSRGTKRTWRRGRRRHRRRHRRRPPGHHRRAEHPARASTSTERRGPTQRQELCSRNLVVPGDLAAAAVLNRVDAPGNRGPHRASTRSPTLNVADVTGATREVCDGWDRPSAPAPGGSQHRRPAIDARQAAWKRCPHASAKRHRRERRGISSTVPL